jgi:hypothetical protein
MEDGSCVAAVNIDGRLFLYSSCELIKDDSYAAAVRKM